jgi:phage baseplate assembly protein W
MAVRAFAAEDRVNEASFIVTREKKFSDVELDFRNIENENNVRTDLRKITDVASVKQSVRNILLTNQSEKPFMPMFGSQLNYLLFELDTELDADIIEEEIANSLEIYEPRAVLRNVHIDMNGEQNKCNVTVEFQVINSGEISQVTIDITRIR